MKHIPQDRCIQLVNSCLTKLFFPEMRHPISKVNPKKASPDCHWQCAESYYEPLLQLLIFSIRWRAEEAEIIPILKKSKKNSCCYRPLSLLNCLRKLLEGMVNTYLFSYIKQYPNANPGCLEHKRTACPPNLRYGELSTENRRLLLNTSAQ